MEEHVGISKPKGKICKQDWDGTITTSLLFLFLLLFPHKFDFARLKKMVTSSFNFPLSCLAIGQIHTYTEGVEIILDSNVD